MVNRSIRRAKLLSARAAPRSVSIGDAVMNSTLCPSRQARWPSAWLTWLFPPAARPNERGDLVARQVVACRQLHDAVAQNLRVELEVERLQRPDLLERGAPDAQIERFGRPALGLVAEQPVAELPGVEVLVGHLPDAQREGREDAGEVQLLEQAGQVFSAAPGSSPAGGR